MGRTERCANQMLVVPELLDVRSRVDRADQLEEPGSGAIRLCDRTLVCKQLADPIERCVDVRRHSFEIGTEVDKEA
jgi:hypothetical protein